MKFPRTTKVVNERGCIAQEMLDAHCKPLGKFQTKGRPNMLYQGERWLSYRLSFHLNVAPIPKGPGSMKDGLVLHRCDNEWCVNPDHLYLGSAKDNTRDIYERNNVVRKKLSATMRGNKHLLGHRHSPETRRKMAAARQAYLKRIARKA